MKRLSIIVPVFNEEENILPFFQTTNQICQNLNMDTSFLFVDDGSSDNTLGQIRLLAQSNSNIDYIAFTTNRGKEAAIYQGLICPNSDYKIIIDGDLQHPPSLIPEMIEILETTSFQAVEAKRKASFLSNCFTFLFNHIVGIPLQYGVTDFICMTSYFAKEVIDTQMTARFSKGIFASIPLPMTFIEYQEQPRQYGKSKWGFLKLTKYALQSIFYCKKELLAPHMPDINNKPLSSKGTTRSHKHLRIEKKEA